MKFIMLNGHSCGGKSTIVKRLMAERGRLYQLSYNSQKWLFSKYSHATHHEDVLTLLLAIAESVCGVKYDIISDGGLFRETREKLFDIARRHGHEITEINLEASFEVLEKRFADRLESTKVDPTRKISNTSKDRFKELYDIYEAEKNPSAITLHTDEQDIDAVFRTVQEIIFR